MHIVKRHLGGWRKSIWDVLPSCCACLKRCVASADTPPKHEMAVPPENRIRRVVRD